VIRDGEDDEAINYFVDLLPRLAKAHPTLEMYQFIAGEGDTVWRFDLFSRTFQKTFQHVTKQLTL